MKAMIFAAGLGTRFKPWTDHHPKALAMVNGKSLLQRNVEYLQQYGITEVEVNVHHFANQIKDAIYRMETLFNHFGSDSLNGFIEEFKKQIDRLEIIKEEKVQHRFIFIQMRQDNKQ